MSGGTGEIGHVGALVPDPVAPTTLAWVRTPSWCFGIGAVAGACGGFVFLLRDDEIAGAAVLAAVVGALLGVCFAALPAVGATAAVVLAARQSHSVRSFRRWVALTLVGLAAVIPVVGFRVYRSFSVDPADGVYLKTDTELATGMGVTVAVAELFLIPMWRSLRTIRDEEPDAGPAPGGPS